MDDEQGPWWTRPPEPGPRVRLRDEDRDTKTDSRGSGTSLTDDEGSDPYDTEIYRPDADQEAAAGQPSPGPTVQAHSSRFASATGRPSGPTPPAPATGRHSMPVPVDQDYRTRRREPQNPSPYATGHTPEAGVPPQADGPEVAPAPPVGRTNFAPPVGDVGQNAATMPLPLIDDPAAPPTGGEVQPGSSTQPNPLTGPPAAAPPAPKPTLRRVAAPEPPPAPPVTRTTRTTPAVPADRNAYAPPQNGDIWATFSGPIALPDEELAARGQTPHRAAPPPPPRTTPVAQPGDDADNSKGPLRRFITVQVPEARFVLIGIAGGLVVLLIVLVALLSAGGGSDDATPTSAQSGSDSELSGTTPTNLTDMKKVKAAKLLRKAGAAPGGKIIQAMQWDDKNGRNLVATVRVMVENSKKTLKVVHVAGLDTSNPTVLRVMTDPDLPECSDGRSGGKAAFSEDGLVVHDLNSDGYAEVIIGWSSRCGNASSTSEAKLALITNGSKYIIRGSGVLGGSGTTAPEPAAKKWPETFYETVSQLYSDMFFPVSS